MNLLNNHIITCHLLHSIIAHLDATGTLSSCKWDWTLKYRYKYAVLTLAGNIIATYSQRYQQSVIEFSKKGERKIGSLHLILDIILK